MTFGRNALALFDMGYPILPAVGKRILEKDWTTLQITREQVEYWATNGQAGNNIGMRCADDSVGGVALTLADIDITVVEVASAVTVSLEEYFGVTIERRGQAPKRGLIYAMASAWSKIQTSFLAPDGIQHKVEWLARGQQFVAMGIHPDTKKPYTYRDKSVLETEPWEYPVIEEVDVLTWQRDILPGLVPADWVIVTSSGNDTAPQPAAAEDRALLNYKPKLDMDWAQVRSQVLALDANMDHDSWVKVMMAIHHQSGGSDDGLALAHEWSAQGEDYKRREVDAKWRSMKDDPSRGRIVTMATVIQMVGARHPEEKVEARVSWEEKITSCANEHEIADLAREIADDRTLIHVDLARLAAKMQIRLREHGVPMPIADVRAMLRPSTGGRSSRNSGGAPIAAWCEPYVWCQYEDCFIHVPTQEAVSTQSFNAAHGRDVRGVWMTAEGYQMAAAQVALQEMQIPVVARRMYLPWALERFDMNGLAYLNTYRPSSIPDTAERWQWVAGDQQAVEAVIKHLNDLIGANEASILIQWLAYNVQNPGRKIRWSPLIKGIEGDGKSLIGEILGRVIGQVNVRTIAPKVLLTDFNAYAEGACVGVLEELKMAGHNRHDAANALKPNITNDTIDIHRKGVDAYNVLNTMNYIAFTNHGDALPLSDGDRRWWVLFSRFTDPTQLPPAHYFDTLFDLIRGHAAALRGWLLEVDLTGFNANGRAPESAAKASMVAAARHEEDEAIMDAIEAGVLGVSKDIISTIHLTNHISMHEPNLVQKGRALAAALNRLNYIKVPQQIKWRGQPLRCWLKDVRLVTHNDSIRFLLDGTGKQIDQF